MTPTNTPPPQVIPGAGTRFSRVLPARCPTSSLALARTINVYSRANCVLLRDCFVREARTQRQIAIRRLVGTVQGLDAGLRKAAALPLFVPASAGGCGSGHWARMRVRVLVTVAGRARRSVPRWCQIRAWFVRFAARRRYLKFNAPFLLNLAFHFLRGLTLASCTVQPRPSTVDWICRRATVLQSIGGTSMRTKSRTGKG